MAAGAQTQAGLAGHLPGAERRLELDVLSTAIVFSLPVIHTLSIFAGYQLVVNRDQSELTTMVSAVFALFSTLWIMPAMMVIAGMAIRYSLQRRSVSEFVPERIARLGMPLLTGLVLIVPIEAYYALGRNTTSLGSFPEAYARFWDVEFSISGFPTLLKAAPPNGLFGVGILWFLIDLLAFTLLLLPLLLYLRGPSGSRVVRGLATFFSYPGAILLLALPIGLVEAFLASEWPSAWNRWVWVFFILYGFVFAGDARFERALVRHRWVALGLGIFLFLVYFAMFGMLLQSGGDPFTDPGVDGVLARLFKGVASWFCVVAVLGIAFKVGSRARRDSPEEGSGPTLFDRVLAYGREAQLPFYVLHEVPIIVIGFYVVQWQTIAPVKFLVILLSSLAITLVVYDLGVRRTAPTRFLFGMRLPRATRVAAPRQDAG